LFSKMRFVSAQLAAYLTDDLWLDNAAHANAQAARISDGLDGVTGVSLKHPTQANEVFVAMPGGLADGLEARGFQFHRSPLDAAGSTILRLVASFETTPEAADVLVAAVKALAE